MEENRNFILAIVLTMIILFGWEFFFGSSPSPEEQIAMEQATADVSGETAGIPNMSERCC